MITIEKEKTQRQLLRDQVYAKYNGRCAYCGTEFIHVKVMHVDHIIPSAKGGPDHLDNYNPACASCNHTKSNLSIEEFRTATKNVAEVLYHNNQRIAFCIRLGIFEFNKDITFYFERIQKEEVIA